MMIIGLTGLNGSGKGVAAEYLVSKKGFKYHSLSDAVREEILKNDGTVTREKLIVTANRMRKAGGPAVLAESIIKKINKSEDTVVDSFRNPEEVRAFLKLPGFELWNIEASRENRFQRIKARKRENDPQTLDEFIRIEEKELASSDPAQQNLTDCRKLAHRTVENNGTLDELHKRIEDVLTTRREPTA